MSPEHELEEIIKEIAAKHGIAVGRDDPILGSPYKLMQVVIIIDFWHSTMPNITTLMA